MTTFSPCVPLTGLPPADADRPDLPPEVSTTAMTIAMVDEPETQRGAADVVARLATLAVADELVVVYGSHECHSTLSMQRVVAGLRRMLPRHTVVILYAATRDGLPLRDTALLDELLELGCLPIVVAPTAAVAQVAAQLDHHLRADRMLTFAAKPVSRAAYTRSAA